MALPLLTRSLPLAAVALACTAARPAGEAAAVPLTGAETRLAPTAFGGITRVLRFDRAQPDRSETDYVLLAPGARGALPQEVQVVGAGGAAVQLSDQEGDCTLERVLLRRRGGSAEVLHAVRVFSGDPATDVNSEPAAMDITVFRPVRGQVAGDSAVMLRPAGPPRRTRPLCDRASVEREMLRAGGAGAR